ncbi:hypothetical protein D9M69_242390 [compost metagenome]
MQETNGAHRLVDVGCQATDLPGAVADHLVAGAGTATGLQRGLGGLPGVARNLLGGAGKLLGRRRGLFGLALLGAGALVTQAAAVAELLGGAVQLVDAAANPRQHVTQVVGHLSHRHAELAEFVATLLVEVAAEVAGGDPPCLLQGALQRWQQRTADHQAGQPGEPDDHQRADRQQPQDARPLRLQTLQVILASLIGERRDSRRQGTHLLAAALAGQAALAVVLERLAIGTEGLLGGLQDVAVFLADAR